MFLGLQRAGAVISVMLILGACTETTFVERVVLVNDTDYTARVSVRGHTGGWLALTTVPANDTEQVGEVIDQGESWRFRFSYAGYAPVEVEIDRDRLVDSAWRVEVPSELEQKLRSAGVPPPP